MTQEEKQLLLKDLCARLPYKVKCATKFGDSEVVNVDMEDSSIFVSCVEWVYSFKPYLRPMSSMTEEERKELETTMSIIAISTSGNIHLICATTDGFDWLNKKMFDYRGLIEKGLAIAVTEENNPYKD